MQPPRTEGWFCLQYRRWPEAPSFTSECYRTEYTCVYAITWAPYFTPNAVDFTFCRPRTTAFCFVMTDEPEANTQRLCFDNLAECKESRTRIPRFLPPHLQFTDCELKH